MRGPAGGLSQRGPGRLQAQGAEAEVAGGDRHGDQQVLRLLRRDHTVGHLERLDRVEELALVVAVEAAARVPGAVAVVDVVAGGDGVGVAGGTCISGRGDGVPTREHVLANQAARLAHVDLRRDAVRLGELVSAQAPLTRVRPDGGRDRRIVLQELQQADVVQDVLAHEARRRETPQRPIPSLRATRSCKDG